MPTMNDVVVDPEAPSGQVTSPISQDTAQNASPSDPTATDEVDGASEGCPAVLSGVYDCPKVEEGVIQGGKLGWVCHWCTKWFSGRHLTRALNHVLKIKMKKGIAACVAAIDPEATKRYVCCCVF